MAAAALTQILGIDPQRVELLSAVGMESCGLLSQGNPGALLEEMERANRHLELVEKTPTLDELISWIEAARKIEGTDGPPLVTRLEKVIELVPVEVLKAVAVTKESIVKNKISVGDVPEMSEFLGKDDLLEERVVDPNEEKLVSVAVREIAPKSASQEERAKQPERKKVEPLARNTGFDIRKTASPELNAGKKLHSRAYVRGVLHPQPGKVKVGAFFTFFTFLLLPANFVVGLLILTIFKDRSLEENVWFLAVPAAFLVFGLLYLMFAKPVKCRICGQPVFSPKACRRHTKAHRIPLLGYIFPTTLHMWLFHWFRCIYCGTSVRLKK